MRPVEITLANLVTGDDVVALEQTSFAAGSLTLAGDICVNGVAWVAPLQLDYVQLGGLISHPFTDAQGQKLVFTSQSGASNAGTVFTVTGLAVSGSVISEAITGPGASASVTTVNDFITVTSITSDGGWSALSVGLDGETLGASGPTIPVDRNSGPFNASLTVELTGTATATWYSSSNDVFDPQETMGWFPVKDLTGVSDSQQGNIMFPVRAVRPAIDTFTAGASARFTYLQATTN